MTVVVHSVQYKCSKPSAYRIKRYKQAGTEKIALGGIFLSIKQLTLLYMYVWLILTHIEPTGGQKKSAWRIRNYGSTKNNYGPPFGNQFLIDIVTNRINGLLLVLDDIVYMHIYFFVTFVPIRIRVM